MSDLENLKEICAAFDLKDAFEVEKLGAGHINDTFRLSTSTSGSQEYVLQRINQYVFKRPKLIMENIDMIRGHLIKSRLISRGETEFLNFLPTRNGNLLHQDSEGRYWRINPFIPNLTALSTLEDPVQAHKIAEAYGSFTRRLCDLDPTSIHATISNFHDPKGRLDQLEQAIEEDSKGRVDLSAYEISFIRENVHIITEYEALISSEALPLRIVHNDAKMDNVLFDAKTNEVVCVIDLDTVMPGYVLFDFGDMIRTMTPNYSENYEPESDFEMRLSYFKALVDGYLSEIGDKLEKIEIENLVFAGKLMTLVQAIRFVNDYLQGDKYYSKISSPDHNLIRTRNQIALLKQMMEQEESMLEIVSSQ